MGRFDMACSYVRQHNQAVLICINGAMLDDARPNAEQMELSHHSPGMTWQSWSEFQLVRAELTIVHSPKIVTCR